MAQPESLIEAKLPQSITDALRASRTPQAPGVPGVPETPQIPGTPSIREILDRIKYDQGRARDGKADC